MIFSFIFTCFAQLCSLCFFIKSLKMLFLAGRNCVIVPWVWHNVCKMQSHRELKKKMFSAGEDVRVNLSKCVPDSSKNLTGVLTLPHSIFFGGGSSVEWWEQALTVPHCALKSVGVSKGWQEEVITPCLQQIMERIHRYQLCWFTSYRTGYIIRDASGRIIYLQF